MYDGVYYGTLLSEVNRSLNAGHHLIFDVDVVGGINIKKHFGATAYSIFIQAPSIEVLEHRLRHRCSDAEESIRERIEKAAHEWIAPFNDTARIPIQERLFNGGENSVRSFKQSKLGPRDSGGKPAGGEVRTTLSLELRQRVLGHLSAAAFGDYGNVALAAARPLEGFRAAVGGGLRYNLPIGPLRLDVGVNPRPRKEEDAYVIHFAVGMPF